MTSFLASSTQQPESGKMVIIVLCRNTDEYKVLMANVNESNVHDVNCFSTGLFSNIMRELANVTHSGPKWIVLDGDIDPMWIESLNTVMDDNKV